MAINRLAMTDEQRKSVALEYLKAFDNKGMTSAGGSIQSRHGSLPLACGRSARSVKAYGLVGISGRRLSLATVGPQAGH